MTPNSITYSRFMFGFLMVCSAYFGNMNLFVLFYFIAIISDILDGFLARKLKKTTKLGKKLDISADTFIVACVAVSLFFLGKIRYIEIFLAIFLYYLIMQLSSFVFKRKLMYHRSVAANLAAIVFPFLIFSMLFYEFAFLVYLYAILMIYSLTEKLFLNFKIKKNIRFYLVCLVMIGLIILISTIISKKTEVCFEETCIEVEIMDSIEERSLGLMFRKELDENKGMLFIFEQPGYYQFYMKNMLIPIDMIFVDENMNIVKIFQEVQPCKADQCALYFADVPVRYVIEVKDGFSKKHNIEEGQKIEIN